MVVTAGKIYRRASQRVGQRYIVALPQEGIGVPGYDELPRLGEKEASSASHAVSLYVMAHMGHAPEYGQGILSALKERGGRRGLSAYASPQAQFTNVPSPTGRAKPRRLELQVYELGRDGIERPVRVTAHDREIWETYMGSE